MMSFEITNVLGETRAIESLYAWNENDQHHQAYSCPFCGSACVEIQCQNPACSAGKWATVETAQKAKDQAEARAKEEAERKRNHEWTMERIRQENAERAARHDAFVALIRERGGCFKCSDYYRSKVRKHRKECPKA